MLAQTERKGRNYLKSLPPVLLFVFLLFLLLPSQSPGDGGGGSALDSVSSLDDLLLLLHPESSRLQLCLRRRSQNPTPLLLHSAGGGAEEEEELWGRPRQEALRRADGVLEGTEDTELNVGLHQGFQGGSSSISHHNQEEVPMCPVPPLLLGVGPTPSPCMD